MFPVLFGDEGMPAVRTAQLQGREAALGRREPGGTNFAEKLPFGAVIPVEKRLGSLTAGTGTVIRDVAFRAAADRTDLLAITFIKVRDEIFISPVLTEVSDQREFISFELLVLGRVGIIESQLLERDISANEVNKPAVLLVKILNYIE